MEIEAKFTPWTEFALFQAVDVRIKVRGEDRDICLESCPKEHTSLFVELIFDCIATAVCRGISRYE